MSQNNDEGRPPKDQPGSGKQGVFLPEQVDFTTLVLGFSSAALYYLGDTPIGGQKVKEKNLPLAKQNIDILGLLKEKTNGNLTPDEDKLLSQVLSDLRLRYIETSKTC